MKIGELKGYKAHPLHKAAKDILGKGHGHGMVGTSDPLDRFDEFMSQHGFRLIGSGSYGNVYEKDGYPWVFKVFMDDPGYLWYVKWSAKHQDNPNVPRMKGLPMQIAPNTYMVRIEQLDRISTSSHPELLSILRNIETIDDISKEDLQWIRANHPGIYDILHATGKVNFTLDMNPDNIMQRGSTPVIIDPIVP